MKRFAKAFLKMIGLLPAATAIYSSLKSLTPAVFWKELRLLVGRNGDGLTLPSGRLVYQVIRHPWRSIYLESGRAITADMLAQLKRNGLEFETRTAVLDFGCGCGRLLRHLREFGAGLYGCDINAGLISWCQKNLSFADFKVNGLEPPLDYPSQKFDWIYSRSVFTHLDQPLQIRWIDELHRILKPNGILLFTTHGRQYLNALSLREQAVLEEKGLVVVNAEIAGDNACLSYTSRSFVENNLLREFTLVDYIAGRPGQHLRQDTYILRRN